MKSNDIDLYFYDPINDPGLDPTYETSATIQVGNPTIDLDQKYAFLKDDIQQIIDEFRIETISTSPGRIETDLLNALNKKIVQGFSFNDVKDRLANVDIRIDELFWDSVKGNLATVEDVKSWAEIVFNEDKIEVEDKEFVQQALSVIPPDPWDENTWELWTNDIKQLTGRKGKELFLPLREAFTGVSQGPEMKKLIQLIGRDKIIERVKL